MLRLLRISWYRLLRNILSAGIPFALSSCQNTSNSGSDSSIYPIDSPIGFDFRQVLQSKELEFLLETKKVYPTSPWQIDTRVSIENNSIEIVCDKITEPPYSFQYGQPARSYIKVGNLVYGRYSLQIRINGSIALSTLKVDSLSISLEDFRTTPFWSNSWIQARRNTVFKVPPSLVWGIAWYQPNSADQRIASQFIDSLKVLGARDIQLSDGNYGYFKTRENQLLIEPPFGYTGFPNAQAYLFDFKGDTIQVQAMIKRFKTKSLLIYHHMANGSMYF